uniref:Uncharacterized protein n=1 Tax=Arundo donax TaxID=35708 RepID=A0A0A8Z2T2_ARUDO
MKLFLYVNL